MFTSQELQQLKSILAVTIDDLEAHRSIYKQVIAEHVEYKKPFVVSGNKDIVDRINGVIRDEYKEVEKTDKKLKKLRALQRRIKEEMTDATIIARYESDVDGWTASSSFDDDLTSDDYVAPEPPQALVDAMARFKATDHAGYAAVTNNLMSSNEGWQDHKMESFATTGFAQVHNPNKLEMKDFWPTPGESILTVTDSQPRVVTLPYIPQPAVEATDTSSKPSNPKDAIGSGKLPIHLWPNTATAMGCIGFLNGLLKYGRSNFRAVGIRASIYYDAAKRHLDAWFEGEECDPDDDVPHLAAALACIAIIVDAEAAGKLNDDRAYPGGYRALVERLTPLVAQLKNHHAAKNPHHYSIADVK